MMKVFPGIDFHQKKWKEWKKKNNFKSQYVIRLTQKYFLCFLSLSFIESHLMVSDRANIKWKETCLLDCLEGVKLFTFFFFILSFSFHSIPKGVDLNFYFYCFLQTTINVENRSECFSAWNERMEFLRKS